jgi:AraC-like DNA-binding protein
MVVKQDDIERVLEPGDGIILDAVRPHSGRCALESDTWVVRIPGSLLQTLRSKDAETRTIVLERDLGVTQLIIGLLQAHEQVIDHVSEHVSFLTGQHLADLVVAAMGADKNGRHLIEGRGVKAARLQALLDDIAQHYVDTDLSADAVAARLGLTPRYVHLLLEDTGQSFSEHVLELRLRLARRLLVGPHRAGEKISDIAYRCGFSDLSYFNRTFRRRFGQTPSDLRSSARTRGGPGR